MSDARERIDFPIRQMPHDIVCVVKVVRYVRRSADPVASLVRVSRLLTDPVATAGAQAKDWPRHTRTIGPLQRLAGDGCPWLRCSQIGLSTRRVLAWRAREPRQIVIEAVEIHTAIVRRKGPLSDYDGSKLTLQAGDRSLLSARVRIVAYARVWVLPSLVDVRIQGSLRTTCHKAAPYFSIEAEGVVHDILPVWSILLYNKITIPVELRREKQKDSNT
jgi:hypothetical protein